MIGTTEPAQATPSQDVAHEMPPGIMTVDMEDAHEPNMVAGLSAGLIVTLLCAAIWTAVTVATGYQIGWMAIGVGVAVGYAVRMAGHGTSKGFGILGAVLALIGCLIGNFFSALLIAAQEQQIPVMEALSAVSPDLAVALMSAWFQPIDLLFYGIALYEGYHFGIARVHASEHMTFEHHDDEGGQLGMPASIPTESAGQQPQPQRQSQPHEQPAAPQPISGVGRFAAANPPDEPTKAQIKIAWDDESGDDDRQVA